MFARWVERVLKAMQSRDADAFGELMVEDGYWRDILSFTGGFRTFSGRGEILRAWRETECNVRPHAFRVAPGRTPARSVRRSGCEVVEGYFAFETNAGKGVGFARLRPAFRGARDAKASLLLTTLQEMHGAEEQVGDRRPDGLHHKVSTRTGLQRGPGPCLDGEPQVLIVGGGQAGLALGARLRQMGVDSLILEKRRRLGDNWRDRYTSLTLHNAIWANHLPYLRFPETWPTFLAKDQLANWLEGYADYLDSMCGLAPSSPAPSMTLTPVLGPRTLTVTGGIQQSVPGIWCLRRAE